MASKAHTPALKMTKKWVCGILAVLLMSLTLGMGCGSAATPAPKECCKSICQHPGDFKDPQKCCQTAKRSKLSLGVPFGAVAPAKKVFESVLLVDTHSQHDLVGAVLVEQTSVSPTKIFKPPQQKLYKRISTLLI